MADVDREKYEKFIQSHPKGHFMQSLKWAEVKSNWLNEIITVKDNQGNIKGAMSLLIRKLPFVNYTIMYSPRGPVCDIHDYATIKELIDKAREVARRYKSYVLKLDPDVEKDNLEFQKIVKKLGFRIKSNSKDFEGAQPRFVFRLDIKNKTEEELLMSFHQKVRYNIRLAMRKGVEIRIGSKDDIPEFHKIMVETGIRDKFVVRSASYFEKMLDCLGPDNIRLYLAYYRGNMIAGAIAVAYGNKCWYLYGASSNQHRNVMPNYLLQWEMIKWAVERGCDIYDFRGVSGNVDKNHPLYGLYRFKKGFGGKFTEFIGELDYVFNPLVYFAVEAVQRIYRKTRRRFFIIKNLRTAGGKTLDE
ncbi:MAG: peptidoglycan bridge formation glycyltransferase FemA/FemB family protein [Caldicoprobacter oshimai]|uniref:FemAB family protein n=1 Tax=Caldicoprobacter faecalis TaxID=937334 RepID=A0A1I5T977_9FIRM|nr:peptidoglycan bridge formation glycyltransferase FemA/FemB family protein [Caldicoprobacter faecalis]PZN10356.1 MAG: peptidoglycan bridge formation glycyltransferase FemA/FemB family protein [Caldicoprobacter oshimai]SFP79508.1 FemAB family protein [Caldicoprobacter faecalis]